MAQTLLPTPLPRLRATPEPRFELIAFDWDGTLFDSTAVIVRCIQLAVADVGGTVPSDQDASYVIGLGLMQALARAAPDVPPQRYPELGARYRHHYTAHQDDITLFAGVPAMLAGLKAGPAMLAVATGKSRSGLNQAVRAAGLNELFDATRTADETAGKPHPRMLHELMRQLGATPQRTLMIGDTTHDLEMAANAGCASVGVSYGAHQPQAFAQFGPRFIAHSVPELDAWLRAHA